MKNDDCYISTNEKCFLNAFDHGEEMSESFLLSFVYQGNKIYEGENRRWSRIVESICKIGGRYFKITWDEGLTESQMDYCFLNPIEVEKVEYDKVIPEHVEHIVEWKEINR